MNWNEYFLSVAAAAATRSHCLHRKVGAVLVKDRRIIATGYNGPAAGLQHYASCARTQPGKELDDCRALHAEENAIIQAARYGPSTTGATLYSTLQPCYHCSKMIIQAGIGQMYFTEEYPDGRGLDILKEAGIEVVVL